MSDTSPVVLILGSGPNVGQHVTQRFAAKGFKVALASRKSKEAASTMNQFQLQCDLTDPESVVKVFSEVKERLGLPSVVVYNDNSQNLNLRPISAEAREQILSILEINANGLKAAAGLINDKENPFSLPLANFVQDLNVNTVSVYVAAQQAVLAFEQLPDSASKTFIFTGNILNEMILPPLMSSGVGKSATAHLIEYAANAYKDRGCKFYYADERKPDGAPAYYDIDGEAHGELYLQLAEAQSQGPWQQTFVKGVGYKKFVTE